MSQLSVHPVSGEIQAERRKLKRELTLLPLFGIIFFTVSGGPFGIESLIGWSGPGLALILILLTPLVFSIPNMLMVQELSSMMPTEGGYYHWVKQAFGPFMGFMAGWMNWVVSWLDVSIYPVLAAGYLSYFIPALNQGITIMGIDISGGFLSWLVALMIIWIISALQMRGARLSAMTSTWIGVVMLIPLILMTIFGIYNWVVSGATLSLPLLPQGQNMVGALSTGLFVVMWNYMGWELPSVAGDEIVNPKRTYPLAMALTLIATVSVYILPVVSGLYGGAADGGKYQLWGIEENETGQGIGAVLTDYGVSQDQLSNWGVDPGNSIGWQFPEIASAVGEKAGSKGLGVFMGSIMTIAALLGMIGLFIGNSLGGSRVPFSMAEDGMMPRWMVKVHNKYGTPWVSILLVGIFYSIFSWQAFAFLVVADVFLQLIVIMAEFGAMWKLRFSRPDLPRKKVPGGVVGLVLVTLGPAIFLVAGIYSQFLEEGLKSLGISLAAIVLGVLIYFPIKILIKPGVPDVNPFEAESVEV